jgi:hypothetical protein
MFMAYFQSVAILPAINVELYDHQYCLCLYCYRVLQETSQMMSMPRMPFWHGNYSLAGDGHSLRMGEHTSDTRQLFILLLEMAAYIDRVTICCTASNSSLERMDIVCCRSKHDCWR